MDLQSDASSSNSINECWKRVGIWGDHSCPELAAHAHCLHCPIYSSAAVRLLDRELPAGYEAEWTAHFAQTQRQEADTDISGVVFRLGEEWLVLPTGIFQEIAAVRPIHSLPHRRSGAVLGLVNVRGELLVCMSLAAVLGIEVDSEKDPREKYGSNKRRLLVLSGADGRRVASPVDEVHGVRRFALQTMTPPPGTVSMSSAAYTKGMLLWENRSVGLLDEQLLFYSLNRSFA